jgi:hypothetical protein
MQQPYPQKERAIIVIIINDNEFWRYLVHHILQPLELSYPPIQMSIYWGRLIVCLFVCLCTLGLFVTFRSPKPQCTSLGSCYHLKADLLYHNALH